MGIPPDQAADLDLWEYEAILYHWNRANSGEGEEVDAPDPEVAMQIVAMANADPRLTGRQPTA